MATIIINGVEYPIPEGEKLNAIQMAKRVGVDIPYYCWHPALSVVANCRMCEIEVGAKDPRTGEIKFLPKLVPGCQTPAKDLTVIATDTPKVKEHQRMVMEYLLLNHPLDCPVCDQAGECGLQDYSFHHGQAVHRFVEERAVNPRKEVSSGIQLNADRCIMCTRCVRFTREITHTGELQVMRRGSHAEIDVFPGAPVDNPLAGNVVDICPVGALLDKDFLHKQRAWFLSKHDAVCAGCATGCNVSAEENRGTLWRYKPRHNPHVNDYWICDEGRYSYKAANSPDLLTAMYLKEGEAHRPTPVDQAIKAAGDRLKELAASGGKVAAMLSPFLTVEEAYLFARYIKGLNPANVLVLGPVPVKGEDQTFTPDMTKGRTGDTSFIAPRPFTIRAEKCPNRRGVAAVLQHFEGRVLEFGDLLDQVKAGGVKGLFAVSSAVEPWIDQETADLLRGRLDFIVVEDSILTPLAHQADVVLAGATFAEKAGSYVNALGRLQYSAASLPPRDGSLPDLDLAAILLNHGASPVSSKAILAELAAEIPAFAAARGAQIPEYGIALEGASAGPADAAPPFVDSWFVPQGAARMR